MFFFGHVGLSIGIGHAVNQSVKRKIDLRWAGLFGIMPDLIDKPVTLYNLSFFHNHTRGIAHNLFIAFIFACIWTCLRKDRRAAAILSLFYFGHLLLDRMWSIDPEILFYPFGGQVPWMTTGIMDRWIHVFLGLYTFTGEVIGFLILTYLFVRYRLYETKNRHRFMKQGVLTLSKP